MPNRQPVVLCVPVLEYTINVLQVNIDRADIGVITPYRQQVKLLREGLRCGGHSDVEVNTVDQYQGRDKSVVIISFVKRGKSSLPGVSLFLLIYFLFCSRF